MTKIKNLNQMMENFYSKNISKGKSFVVKHFMSSGMSRATAYRKTRLLEAGSIKRKFGSGRTPTTAS